MYRTASSRWDIVEILCSVLRPPPVQEESKPAAYVITTMPRRWRGHVTHASMGPNSNLPTANSTTTCSSTSTMAATPKRSVHWNYEDMSFSELSSPGSAGSESFVSTSSLEYANAQLLAHGYVDKAGLCLDGVSNADSEVVLRCLLKLLGDRMVRRFLLAIVYGLTIARRICLEPKS